MRTYFDIGCAVGSFAFEYLKDREGMVYAFEPHPDMYPLLKKREESEPRFKVYPYAICEQDGEAWFHVNSNPMTSSLKPFSSAVTAFHTIRKVRVETKRLDTFCKELSIGAIRYLKSDAQGSDLEVLRSLGERLQLVDRIMVEAFITPVGDDVYPGEVKRDDVYNFLVSNGFQFEGQRDDGNYADLIFRRGGCTDRM